MNNMPLDAATEPKLIEVFITSSLAAILNSSKHPWPGYTYDYWSPLTWEDRMKEPAATSYRAVKAVAEMAMWYFKENNKPSFDVTAMNPPLVFGLVINDQKLDSLHLQCECLEFVSGQTKEVTYATAAWIDMRDNGQAHVLNMEAKGNERHFVTAGLYTAQDSS